MQRLCELHLGSRPVPAEEEVHDSQGGLSLGEVGFGADRMRGGVAGARQHFERRRIAVDCTRCVGVRQTGPGERVLRVELGGARVELHSAPRRRRRKLVPEVATTQVEVVCFGVSRLPARQRGQTVGREAKADLLRDGCAQLALELEYAARFRCRRTPTKSGLGRARESTWT